MFSFEKDMIPVLKRYLSKKYQISDTEFISEFNSGNGVADLVFISGKDDTKNPLSLDYDSIFTLLKYFNRKNKKIEVSDLFNDTFLSKKQILVLIEFLIEKGILEKISTNKVLVKKVYSVPVKKIVSIEAKLSDWKSGFYQALRYKTYSHESYLAISSDFAHRVDLDLLKEYNIGLMVVSDTNTYIALRAKTSEPSNSVAHIYLGEKLLQMTSSFA